MRSWSIALALLLVPASGARADAFEWGGRLPGLEVHVVLAGFHEGAGAEGWTPGEAERFARRGAVLAAMVPGLVLAESPADDRGLLASFEGRTVATGLHEFMGTDAEWEALTAFFLDLGFSPRASTAPVLYTLEVAGDDAEVAVEPAGQAYFARCLPCAAPPVVRASGSRRVVGVFGSRAAAREALRALTAAGVEAHVARLER